MVRHVRTSCIDQYTNKNRFENSKGKSVKNIDATRKIGPRNACVTDVAPASPYAASVSGGSN
jgi:hypothetical protein